MATVKAYTDLQQSKVLAEILPLESADMVYIPIMDIDSMSNSGFFNIPECYPPNEFKNSNTKPLPCWSLAALLDVLDYEIVDEEGVSYFLNIYKEDNQYQLCYRYELDDIGEYDIWTDSYDDFVDACYELILKLHELNLL